jgi:NitT/TauT family transport system ATP-binding protein
VRAARPAAWPAEPAPVFALRGCSLTLGETAVARDLSFDVREGELLAVVGPSGCGKSSLLRLLMGLLRADGAGQLEAREETLAAGMVFQKPVLMPWLDAERNVELSLRLGPGRLSSKAERRARTERALRLVGLLDFRRHYPHQLSGGMQQRLAIARALVAEPALLLLDEPFGALDELTRAGLNRELLRIWESAASYLSTIVLVTHSIGEAVALADRVLVLSPRPARVRATVEVELPKPRSQHFDDLEQMDAFREAVRRVRSAIGHT